MLLNRKTAIATFLHYRRTWSPRVSYYLTAMQFDDKPACRLACALTLAAYGIPLDGNWPIPNFEDLGNT